jgi:hypothetical protein
MAQMFDPSKPIPREILEAMLQLSTAESEKSELERQLMFSEQLMKDAVGLDRAPAGAGGVAHVAAKAGQGLIAGKMYKEGRSGLSGVRDMQRKGRGSYFDLANAQMPRPEDELLNDPFQL